MQPLDPTCCQEQGTGHGSALVMHRMQMGEGDSPKPREGDEGRSWQRGRGWEWTGGSLYSETCLP